MSHITIAASEKAFEQLFKAVRDNFSVSKSDSGSFGPFSASYSIQLHLEDGSIQLNNDGTIEIKRLMLFHVLQVRSVISLASVSGFVSSPIRNGCLVGSRDCNQAHLPSAG
jgi:hypothetical protein